MSKTPRVVDPKRLLSCSSSSTVRASLVAAVALALLASATAAACGGNPPASTVKTPLPAPSATANAGAASADDAGDGDAGAAAEPAARLPAASLVLWAASPDPVAPTPVVRITAPKKDEVVPIATALDYPVMLDVRNWQTASGSQHVHLILDNMPYKAVYDTKAGTTIRDLLAPAAPLAEGQHVLVAFPSRPNHESVKTPGALFVTEFWVGAKTTPTVDITKPMLIESRPKGEYKGDMAGHILVDFQLANTTLAPDGNAVTITVKGPNGENLAVRADKFGPPFYLDNAENGVWNVTMALVAKDGNALPFAGGPFGSATRDIKIDRNAVAESMPGMTTPASAPATAGDAGGGP